MPGPIVINARAAARPELGGVERWARELTRRLPDLRPAAYRVVRPRPRLVHLPERPHVVAVDTGSRDGGAALAREWGAEVVGLGAGAGFGAANNAGIARVGTEMTVLLNPDVVLLDEGLLELVNMARARDALLAPRLLNADGTVQRSAHPTPGTLRALLPAVVHPRLLPPPLRLAADPWRAERPRRVGWAVAAALAARTATLRRLGPFDPSTFLFYEDMDLCLSATEAGIRTELHPEIRLLHRGAHATSAHYGSEPHEELARRWREVLLARRGPRALALDDAAQALTFATRTVARALAGRDAQRPAVQLRAGARARKEPIAGVNHVA